VNPPRAASIDTVSPAPSAALEVSMTPRRSSRLLPAVCLTLGAAALVGIPGCELFGVIAANEERYGSHVVPAAYPGLQGKSYAIVVQADRDMLAENPNLMEHLLANLNNRLAETSGASGHVPTHDLVLYLMNNTRWPAMSNADLAAALGNVDRLVVLDLSDYRLTEPQNVYTWDGVAQGRVLVFESDGEGGGQTVFEKDLRVSYPDEVGITPAEQTREVVTSVLAQRLIDRVSWLFYEHEEPNTMTY